MRAKRILRSWRVTRYDALLDLDLSVRDLNAGGGVAGAVELADAIEVRLRAPGSGSTKSELSSLGVWLSRALMLRGLVVRPA